MTATNSIERGKQLGEENGTVLLGYRVPCILASPYTKGNPASPRVAHGLYDHTSVLRFIESNFGLKPLTPRDASTKTTDPANIAAVLARTADPSVPSSIPAFVPPPVVVPCGINQSSSIDDDTWGPLRASGLVDAWA